MSFLKSNKPKSARTKIAVLLAGATLGTTIGAVGLPAPASAATDGSGWNLVAQDDFSGSSVSNNWYQYDGAGNGGSGRRTPSANTVSDGKLSITGRGDTSGGMSWGGPDYKPQTYGRWEVRARMDKGNGYAGVALLWPDSENWPTDGEIDISELIGGDRGSSWFNLHYSSENRVVKHKSLNDFTQWHTFTVDWLPDRVTLYIDGKVEFEVKDPNVIPKTPMHLALQNDTGITPRDSTTPAAVSYQVDWVKIYRR